MQFEGSVASRGLCGMGWAGVHPRRHGLMRRPVVGAVDGDLAAGKMSPLVRFGTELGAQVVNGAAVIPYMVLAVGSAMQILPWPLAIASFLSLPWAIELVSPLSPWLP